MVTTAGYLRYLLFIESIQNLKKIISAHPNVKLFITHGGLLSTTETVYHGVPTLAIPIFGDQKMNAKVAYNNGFGLILPYTELDENSLVEKLNELLNNPKYVIYIWF